MKAWEKINEKLVYDGYRKISRKTFILPDGRQEDFDIILEKDAVAILALTESNEVILAKQFRPGTEEIYDEMPAGLIEENETAIKTAKKELLEETGYEGELKYIGSSVISAYANYRRYCFIATNCKKSDEKCNLDQNEFIEVVTKPINEFITQVKDGKLTCIPSAYHTLNHLKLL